MHWKTSEIRRRAFLSLAVLATLAPVGAGFHQFFVPGRSAATIDDLVLVQPYVGGMWSNRDIQIQNKPVRLDVRTKVRSRFTGTFLGLDGMEFPVTGGVSRTGRVVMNGSVDQSPCAFA